MAPRYRLNQDAFFEPSLVKIGTIIEYSGTPGPHMDPLNQEAVDKMEAYFQLNPHMRAGLGVYDGLPATVGEAAPTMNIISEPPKIDPSAHVMSIGEMALGNAKPLDYQGPIKTDPILAPSGDRVIIDSSEPAPVDTKAADAAAEAEVLASLKATEEAKAAAAAEVDTTKATPKAKASPV